MKTANVKSKKYSNQIRRDRNGSKLITKVITMTGDEWDDLKCTDPDLEQTSIKTYIANKLDVSYLVKHITYNRALMLLAAICYRFNLCFWRNEEGTTEISYQGHDQQFDQIAGYQDAIATEEMYMKDRARRKRRMRSNIIC